MGTHGKNWGGNIGNPQIENPDYATAKHFIRPRNMWDSILNNLGVYF